MKRICSSLAAGLLAALAITATAQQDFSKVEIKITHVAGNVHMLEGAGGNIGVSAGADGVLIVDSQFAPLSPKIEAAIGKLGKGRPKFLLNTHWHGDHTGGNANFGRYAHIIAHQNVRVRLSNSGGKPAPKEALPVITFDDSLSVHFNGEEIRLIKLQPGHTDGDSLILFTGSKVAHTGDQFLNSRLPFFDLASGGDAEGYLKNIVRMTKEIPADYKIIPGHGELATFENLKATHEMLELTIGKVKKDIAAGRTLDQVKADGVPARYKDWGAGFINAGRYLELTYNSLNKK
jgi:glyoxylase-like metal-dependent hydrolase (beta-lactamase superfamily II)